MKKFKFYYLFAFIALGLFTTSCEDDDHDHEDVIVSITFNSPMDKGTIEYENLDTVNINISVSSTDELHSLEAELHWEEMDSVIWKYEPDGGHVHEQSYEITDEINLTDYAGECLHLEVKAEKEHGDDHDHDHEDDDHDHEGDDHDHDHEDDDKYEMSEIEFCLEEVAPM